MSRLLPASLLGRLALLSAVAMILAHFGGFWVFSAERTTAVRAAQRVEAIARTERIAALVEAADPAVQAQLIAAATAPALDIALGPGASVDAGAPVDGATWPGLRSAERLDLPAGAPHPPEALGGMRHRMMTAGFAPVALELSLPLADGTWLNATAHLDRAANRLPPQALGSTLLALALILAALGLGLRWLTRPLSDLARAADAFGLDTAPPQMPARGPREVRALAEALTRMQERLARMIGERTRMLAALGHDLRTPITALRLQAEMVDDTETRDRMVATLDEMQEMTETTLAFARGVSADGPTEPVDLAALLAELAEEASSLGADATFAPNGPVILALRRVPIRRALRNLIENAQRHGGGARVSLEQTDGTVRIIFDDDGPGIDPADLDRVFDPFERLETSRSRDTGGTGLGLPITRAILRAHGGEIRLENRPRGGLRVIARLPKNGV